MAMGGQGDRFTDHLLDEGQWSSEAALNLLLEMGERRTPNQLEGQDGHRCSWGREQPGAV